MPLEHGVGFPCLLRHRISLVIAILTPLGAMKFVKSFTQRAKTLHYDAKRCISGSVTRFEAGVGDAAPLRARVLPTPFKPTQFRYRTPRFSSDMGKDDPTAAVSGLRLV